MKQNTPADLPAVGAHFLEFVIQFFTLTKIQYQQQNQIKANTQGFQLLFLLNHQEEASLTMSELAAQMHTTKQQLTRLVNALEEKRLVRRIHDTQNRRLVYLSITPEGKESMKQLKQAMLSATVEGLSGFSADELNELDDCLKKLSSLLPRFNPDSLEKNIFGRLFLYVFIWGLPGQGPEKGKKPAPPLLFIPFPPLCHSHSTVPGFFSPPAPDALPEPLLSPRPRLREPGWP